MATKDQQEESETCIFALEEIAKQHTVQIEELQEKSVDTLPFSSVCRFFLPQLDFAKEQFSEVIFRTFPLLSLPLPAIMDTDKGGYGSVLLEEFIKFFS